jgi:hypothetical protein
MPTNALISRLAALDAQMGALLRGEGRAPSELGEQVTGLQEELAGLQAEVAALRELQESTQQSLQEMMELLRGLAERPMAPLLLTTLPPTRAPAVTPPAPLIPGGILIEPVRPRLDFEVVEPIGPISVLKLDGEPQA